MRLLDSLYDGTDEGYAVNELYLKLKEEIAMRKRGIKINGKNTKKISPLVIFFIIFFGIIFLSSLFATKSGYYHSGSWYVYKNNDWTSTGTPSYSGNLDDYYVGNYYNSNSNYSDIRDSSVYD